MKYLFSCLALIYLSNGDHAGAKKIQREGYGLIQDYDKYDGSYLLDGKLPRMFRIYTLYHRFSELINVNESGTAEDFANLVKNPYFRSLENDYVKLVKKLEKIEGVEQEVDLNALPTEERNGFFKFRIGPFDRPIRDYKKPKKYARSKRQ